MLRTGLTVDSVVMTLPKQKMLGTGATGVSSAAMVMSLG